MSTVSSNLALAACLTIATASGTEYLRPFSSSASAAFLRLFSCAISSPVRLIASHLCCVRSMRSVAGRWSFAAFRFVLLVDDVDPHRTRGAGDALHRGVDVVGVHVGELQRGQLPKLLGRDFPYLVLVRLFRSAARLLDGGKAGGF